MEIDCTIGGSVDFKIKAGETWQAQLNLLDANNAPIPLANFIIGPLEVFDRSGNVILKIETTDFIISGTSATFSINTSETTKKNLVGYKFRCPFLPPGGTPRAIVDGKTKVI